MEAARAMPASTRLEPKSEAKKSSNGLTLAPATPVDRDRGFESLELPPGPRLSGAVVATLAAIAGMSAIALGAWAFVASIRADDAADIARAQPISSAAQAISLLSKPDTARVTLTGSGGRAILAVASNGRGMLVIDGLGIAPVGRTYQAWVLASKPRTVAPLPAALFSGVETIVPLTARIQPGSVVGISIERTGGAPAPTKPLRLVAQRPAG